MKPASVRARKCDIERFQAKARRGEIPGHAVPLLANCYAAARKAQSGLGPGYAPLIAIMDSFPQTYVENCIKKRLRTI